MIHSGLTIPYSHIFEPHLFFLWSICDSKALREDIMYYLYLLKKYKIRIP
jgi:hypothetical protein